MASSSFNLLCFYELDCFCFWFVCFSTMRSGLIWFFFFQQGLLWPRLALKSLCKTSDLEFLNLPPPASQGLVFQTSATTPLVALHQVFVLVFYAFMNLLGWWGAGRGYAHGLVCMCILQCACGSQRTIHRFQVFPSNMLVPGFKRQWSDLAASSFIVWPILSRPHSGFLCSFHIWFDTNMFCGKLSICLDPGFVTEKTASCLAKMLVMLVCLSGWFQQKAAIFS